MYRPHLTRSVIVPHDPPFVRRPSSKALPEGDASAIEPVGDSLDAEAAALLADIDAFDIEAARRRVQEIDARNTGPRRSSTVFPGVAPDPGLPSIPALPEAVPAAAQEVPVEREKAGPGGFLAQLRDEVATRQRRADEAFQEQGAADRRVDLPDAATQKSHGLSLQVSPVENKSAGRHFLNVGQRRAQQQDLFFHRPDYSDHS